MCGAGVCDVGMRWADGWYLAREGGGCCRVKSGRRNSNKLRFYLAKIALMMS